MKPSSAKAKGRLLQQCVARDVLSCFPRLTEDDVKSTPMGVNGPDVQLSQMARDMFPYSVECKAVEKLNVWSAWEQCRTNLNKGDTPLLIFKRNRSEMLAVLPWPHLVELLKSLHTIYHNDPEGQQGQQGQQSEMDENLDSVPRYTINRKRLRDSVECMVRILDEIDGKLQ